MTIQTVVKSEVEHILSQRGMSQTVKPTDSLSSDLGFSSLEMILLLTNVCRDANFDIAKLSDIDLAYMETVQDIWTRLEAA